MALASIVKYIGRSSQTIAVLSEQIGCRSFVASQIRYLSTSNLETFKYADLSIQIRENRLPKPDFNNLVFGKNFTDHMLEVEWTADDGWGCPRIVPFHHLTLHPAATSLHYAIELFEGMKGYRGVDGKVRLFRPNMNMERMVRTAKRAGLPSFDKEELTRCIAKLLSVDRDWIPQDTSSSIYIRPTLISTEPTIGVLPPRHALLYVITGPVGPYFQSGTFNPVTLLADDVHVRAWKGGVGQYKMGCNYGPGIVPQVLASQKGCQQILWLFGDNYEITEAGTMNCFMFWENKKGEMELVTPSLDGTILPGVTRASILELARHWGEFKVTEGSFTMEDLLLALKEKRVKELFGAGTACVVCPIGKVLFKDVMYDIPTMSEGAPLATRFLNTLTDIHYGKVKSDWTCDIDELVDEEEGMRRKAH